MPTCAACVALVGHRRRARTSSRSLSSRIPARSFDSEQVGRSDRVLDRQVDADAADRRHRVRRVADAEQARLRPLRQAIDGDGEQLDVVPRANVFGDVRGQHRPGLDDLGAEFLDRPLAQRVGAALGDHECALPVVAAVDGDDEVAGRDPRQAVVELGRIAPDAKPEHVDRRAEVLDGEPGAGAHGRMAAVAADGEVGSDLEVAVGRGPAHADDAPRFLDQAGDVGARAQRERRQLPRLVGDEIEELPLRHHRDERIARRQAAEVAELDVLVAEPAADHLELLVRALQELVEQAELVHDAQRRRVDGVAAEIAQEVGMLLEHHRAHAGARHQVAEHHAGGSAAGDATGDRGRVSCRLGHRASPAPSRSVRSDFGAALARMHD